MRDALDAPCTGRPCAAWAAVVLMRTLQSCIGRAGGKEGGREGLVEVR